MEARRGHQGHEFLNQFTITHDHVRRAVAPGCFHLIRQATAGKTLQTLDSQWRPQHIAAQIFQLLPPMCRQTDICMNTESIDIGATPRGWFRLLRGSSFCFATRTERYGCRSLWFASRTKGAERAGFPRAMPISSLKILEKTFGH